MPIKFHCDHCGKGIEAQDSAGGKWGKCPACHNKVYVPAPESDEGLKLAPVDESDEARQKRLMAETYQLTAEILKEREVLEGSAEPAAPATAYRMSDEEVKDNIVTYLRQMADGELDLAREIADLILSYRAQALAILDEIAVGDIPESQLADIPGQVLSGLIRNLRSRLT
jgi:hypothetical protein